MRSSARRLSALSFLLCACGPLVPVSASSGDAGTSGGGSESGDAESSSGLSESSSGAQHDAPAVGTAAVHVVPTDNHAGVRAFVAANLEALRVCYVAALEEEPSLAGRFSIEVAVESTGKPSEVSVSDAGLPESLRACWVAEVSGWTFPLDVPVFTTVQIPGALYLE